VHGSRAAAVAKAEGRVAVVPVRGVLMPRGRRSWFTSMAGVEDIVSLVRSLVNDRDVKAIIMDYDTPGGSAHLLGDFSDELHALRGTKPIIAQVSGMAASAGYWLAAQADEIVVSPSSSVGSIGVLAMHENLTKLAESMGVQVTVFSAGKYKAEIHPFVELTDEARGHIQSLIDATYQQFVGAVARGRNVSAATVRDDFGQGRTVAAEASVSTGMADRVGTLESTLNRFGASRFPVVTQSKPGVRAAKHALRRVALSDRRQQ
jgi:signal peptide peptidase SppA